MWFALDNGWTIPPPSQVIILDSSSKKMMLTCRVFPTFYCGCPYEKEIQKFSFTPVQSTLGNPKQKYLNFFALIKNIFLKTIVEIIFRYH